MLDKLDEFVVVELELAGIVANSRRIEFYFFTLSHFRLFGPFGFVFNWICCDSCCFSPSMWFLDVHDFRFACIVVFDDFVQRLGLDVEA